MKKENPFERIKNLLSLSSPESYKPLKNKIPGEKFLPKYKVNESTVVENPTRLYGLCEGINMDKSFRDRFHIQIQGAETNKGRWVACYTFLFQNSGGGSLPCMRELTKYVSVFNTKEAAIIYYSEICIELCDRENSALSRRFKKKIIEYRDELLINMS